MPVRSYIFKYSGRFSWSKTRPTRRGTLPLPTICQGVFLFSVTLGPPVSKQWFILLIIHMASGKRWSIAFAFSAYVGWSVFERPLLGCFRLCPSYSLLFEQFVAFLKWFLLPRLFLPTTCFSLSDLLKCVSLRQDTPSVAHRYFMR